MARTVVARGRDGTDGGVRLVQPAPCVAVACVSRHIDRQRCNTALDSSAFDGCRERRAGDRLHRSIRRRADREARGGKARYRAGAYRIANAMDLLITALLIIALFVLLGSGVWIGV